MEFGLDILILDKYPIQEVIHKRNTEESDVAEMARFIRIKPE